MVAYRAPDAGLHSMFFIQRLQSNMDMHVETCDWCLQLGEDLELIRRSLSDAQDLSGYDMSSDGDLRVLYRHIKGERGLRCVGAGPVLV